MRGCGWLYSGCRALCDFRCGEGFRAEAVAEFVPGVAFVASYPLELDADILLAYKMPVMEQQVVVGFAFPFGRLAEAQRCGEVVGVDLGGAAVGKGVKGRYNCFELSSLAGFFADCERTLADKGLAVGFENYVGA